MFEWTNTELMMFTVITLITWYCVRSRRPRCYPPGPFPLPVIGNFYNIKDGDMLGAVRRLRIQYGDIFSLSLGEFWVIFVNGADNIRECIKRNGEKMLDRPAIYPMKIADNMGIVSSNGNMWREHRTFALNKLRSFGFGKRDFESRIVEEVEELLNLLRNTDGAAVELNETINMSISNNILSIIMGQRYEYNDSKFRYFINLLAENFKKLELAGPVTFCPTIFSKVPIPGLSKAEMLKTRQFYRDAINEHKTNFDENNIRDFIDAFLQEIKNSDGKTTTFTEYQLLSVVGDLFAAGTESTATIIRWAILYLIHNNKIQEKMFQEINDVVGQSRLPCLADRSHLPYCEAVILETLRIGNILPFGVPYSVKEEFTFNGHVFPVGAIVFLSLDSAMYSEETFPDSNKFMPERFIDEKGNLCGKDTVLAFSTGRRSCLGESLARMELFLYLTSMIQRFKFSSAESESLPTLKGRLGITYTPSPYKCRAYIR